MSETLDFGRLADTIEKIGRAFEEHKAATDASLAEIKSRGAVSPETEAKLAKINAELDSLGEMKRRLETVETRAARPGGPGTPTGTPEEREYRSAFFSWVRNPRDQAREMRLRDVARQLQTKANGTDLEQRAAQVITSTGSAGGFALPEEIARQIARLSVDISPIRQISRVVTVGTPDYKELFDTNGAGFEWVGENGTRSQTNTPNLAEVAPTFGMASARPRSTEEALDDLFFDVESWLIMSASEAIAQGEGAAFVSGDGTNKPKGFMNYTINTSSDGVRTFGHLQKVLTGVAGGFVATTTSSNPGNTFIDVIHSMKGPLRAGASWVMNSKTLAAVRKLVDLDGNYIWRPGLTEGQPSSILGYSVVELPDMPDIATTSTPIAFGNWKRGYTVVDRFGIRTLRDPYTNKPYVNFYTTKRVGGMVVDSEAIKILSVSSI
jgi:HK97 family phage major capsid protein